MKIMLANDLAICAAVALSALSTPAGTDSTAASGEIRGFALRGVHFVPNQGQWADDSVHYVFRSRGMDIAFRKSSLTMHLRRERHSFTAENAQSAEKDEILQLSPSGRGQREAAFYAVAEDPSPRTSLQRREGLEPVEHESLVLEVTFPGSNPVRPFGANRQSAHFNYYVGDDESKWMTGVPSYGAIVYEDLYDGIDLHITGSAEGILKYEFHCAPRSDHTQIRIRYDGIDSLHLDDSGDLVIDTSFGTLRDSAPIAWQDIGRRRCDVPARFETMNGQTFTITLLGALDPSHPLVIDPEVEWMTYLGGTDVEWGFGVAVDDMGAAIVTGFTGSADFEGRTNEYHGGSSDAFVARIQASGEVDWVTYLGAGGDDLDFDIGRGGALDAAGNILITGWTNRDDFAGANNSYHGGTLDAFAARLSPLGTLDWMTYLGGSADDVGFEISVDPAGGALVVGETYSLDFEGRNNAFRGGVYDAYVARVSPSGTIDWMTYLGGNGGDTASGIAVDAERGIVVAGDTWSTNFQGRNNVFLGQIDAFVARINPTGVVEWMTYLGGSDEDVSYDVAVGDDGAAVTSGATTSTNFVGRNNSHHGGNTIDAFVARVRPSGTIDWMTYIGGSGDERGLRLVLGRDAAALVSGLTNSTNFEGRQNAYHGGVADAYIARVPPSGIIDWMTYLGGSGDDAGFGIAIDGGVNAVLTGRTNSVDFEGRRNDFHGGERWGDAFVLRLSLDRAAELVRFDVVTGTLLAGELSDLHDSDDSYVHTRSGFGQTISDLHKLEMAVSAVTAVDSPATLDLSVEARIDETSGVARLFLRNWKTGAYDEVAQYSIGQHEEGFVIEDVTADDFVNTDGGIDLLIKHTVFAPFLAFTFDSFFDFVLIEVR